MSLLLSYFVVIKIGERFVQYIRQFICLVLLITTPVGFIYPHDYSVGFSYKQISQRTPLKDFSLLTYDEILDLLDEIEFGGLEERCSFEELENINRFLATLAIEGAQDNDFSLEEDVVNLISVGNVYQNTRLLDDHGYSIYPAIFYGDANIILCKSLWKKTKDFVKNHKKEIIIGAVIVVAVVVVVTVAVVATSAAAASAAAAAAVVEAAYENDSGPPRGNKLEPEKEEEKPAVEQSPVPVSVEQVNLLKQELHDHFEPIRELATEEYDQSFREKAREFGAHLTHEALDSISDLASLGPQLQQELVDLSAKIFPESMIPEDMRNPKDNYEASIASGHEKIDQMFSTNQAEYHTEEVRADRNENITRCEMPLPGNFSSAFRTANAGGKHAGTLKTALRQSEKELKKGIASFDKQIALHRDKIANPSKHIKNWHELDPRQQEALINKKWQSDIDRLTEQRDILHDVLKSKLSE